MDFRHLRCAADYQECCMKTRQTAIRHFGTHTGYVEGWSVTSSTRSEHFIPQITAEKKNYSILVISMSQNAYPAPPPKNPKQTNKNSNNSKNSRIHNWDTKSGSIFNINKSLHPPTSKDTCQVWSSAGHQNSFQSSSARNTVDPPRQRESNIPKNN